MITKLPSPFDDLLFVSRIARELNAYINNPMLMKPVTVLHGYPGLGKTEFARRFAETFGFNHQYLPMCEHKRDFGNKKFQDKLLLDRHTVGTLNHHLADNPDSKKVFDCVHVYDEFHDLTLSQQDYFKTLFDSLLKRRTDDRVIICLNTTSKRDVKKQLSEAIFSRSHHINFNVEMREQKQHARDLEEHFPHLSRDVIANLLPDMRKICSKNAHMKMMKEYS
jgi:replication-associated recombination protein RarA